MIIYWLRYRGTFFPVQHGDSLLGRSPDCLIVLGSERVSREHAVVRRIHCGLEIEDLGSRNGTWVNGKRIRHPTVLQPGDVVRLGDDELEVVLKPNARAPVTVSGLSASAAEEAERQRSFLVEVEAALRRTVRPVEHARAAQQVRDLIDEMLAGATSWGVLLAAPDVDRLRQATHTVTAWGKGSGYESWQRDVHSVLARSPRSGQ